MDETWWRAAGIDSIEPVRVRKQSSEFVWVEHSGHVCRESKYSGYGTIHPTWEQARDSLIAEQSAQIVRAENIASEARREIERLQRLKHPDAK